ncbi:MAG TPA: hypothetical protein HA326_04990 [Thermoplasmata archaeon]|nr:hypothetical protein [Thermoplasmata archaeon]
MSISWTLAFLQYLPLATVAVWWGLAALQVARDRYRTWTEVFFLAACLFVGFYALADVFFLTAPTEARAALAALASFTTLVFAITFFMLFAVVFYTRMQTWLFGLLAPCLVVIVGVWLYLVPNPAEDIRSLVGSGPPWAGSWDKTWFTIWVTLVVVYALVMAYALLRTYREVNLQSPRLRRRMLGLFVATLLALGLGVVTNALRGFLDLQIPPLFSSAMVLPGIVSIVTLSPVSTERFSVAVRRWKASRYDIKAAFVIYTDGTLIGAKIRPGEKVIDQDLFGATLDVIQNFMRTSFPTLRGSLSAIKHGDYTLVMERGRWSYLTIILQGEENDQLRRHMRDMLLKYEHDNQPVLADWRGMPSEAVGTDTMLGSLFEET